VTPVADATPVAPVTWADAPDSSTEHGGLGPAFNG
jgi:hypothetical protein